MESHLTFNLSSPLVQSKMCLIIFEGTPIDFPEKKVAARPNILRRAPVVPAGRNWNALTNHSKQRVQRSISSRKTRHTSSAALVCCPINGRSVDKTVEHSATNLPDQESGDHKTSQDKSRNGALMKAWRAVVAGMALLSVGEYASSAETLARSPAFAAPSHCAPISRALRLRRNIACELSCHGT